MSAGKTKADAKAKRGKRKWKAVYRGITAHAAALGCTRPHLWMVLTGRRQSKSLTARYDALVKAQG